ncbi:MAG: hypothetical protein ACLQSR_17280 [Limisphaerales bacterium]
MTHIEWQFGGCLRGWPEPAAMALLATLGVAGMVYVVWFYRRTLGELTPLARRWLAGLRSAVVLLLLLCLANPDRVEDTALPKNLSRTLMVLVDRSPSMSAPDYRGDTRLAAAVRRWREVEPAAKQNFANLNYWRFAGDLQPAASLDDAVNAGPPGSEAHLFASLRQALAKNPAAIVCLTDGLDTSQDDAGKLTAEAEARGVPIYFVPGENHLLPGASLTLREVKAPARVLRQSQFTATAVIETVVAQDQELPVELWVNGKKAAATRLAEHSGRNMLSWPVKVDSGEPGTLTVEFRAGDQAASCVADVVGSATMDVLYYQGALQWGYRFLRGALESDPSFRLTAILNPALQVQLTAANGEALTDLPEDAAELRRFQIVVLAHVFADQLTPGQQKALVDYVRNGGGVLFISPDTEAAEGFSGTALEQMLPVAFAARNNPAPAVQPMQIQWPANAPPAPRWPAAQAGDDLSGGGSQAIRLKPFAPPAGAQRSAATDLFSDANDAALPQFATNAKVRAVKPGAEILAVSGAGAPEVLLARQQFGNGFTAALTTDLLWRWKLSLPSSSHAVEEFWQQLLLSLAPATGEGLRVVKLTPLPVANSPALFAVNGDKSPTLEAVSPTGAHQQLMVTDATTADGPAWQTSFIPTTTGRWEVRATDAAGRQARVMFTVGKKPVSAELLNLPTDLAGMKQMAESTGGALVQEAADFQPAMETTVTPPPKTPEPLWNSGLLLLVMLGLYASELITRRCYKLL